MLDITAEYTAFLVKWAWRRPSTTEAGIHDIHWREASAVAINTVSDEGTISDGPIEAL